MRVLLVGMKDAEAIHGAVNTRSTGEAAGERGMQDLLLPPMLLPSLLLLFLLLFFSLLLQLPLVM